MFKGLFSKKAKTEKKIECLYEKAVFLQRNGKLQENGEIMTEINQLEKDLEASENG